MIVRVERIATLDLLRGIAAMMVVVFHFTVLNPLLQAGSSLVELGEHGRHGVTIFFVISGFVLPHALLVGRYRRHAYGKFIAKRLLRLEPPYLASIAVILLIGFAAELTPGFHGQPSHIAPMRLILHLGYLNSYFGYESLNVVYWTLAIELQFYLLIGLTYPFAVDSKPAHLLFMWAAALTLSFLGGKDFLPYWLPIFLCGIVAFQYRHGVIRLLPYLIGLCSAAFMAGWHIGVEYGVVAMLTSLVIAFIRSPRRPVVAFFANISYSLYLLHVPIGMRALNLMGRFAVTPFEVLIASLASIGIVIGAAWAFYRLVEVPSQKWASRMKYGATTSLPRTHEDENTMARAV